MTSSKFTRSALIALTVGALAAAGSGIAGAEPAAPVSIAATTTGSTDSGSAQGVMAALGSVVAAPMLLLILGCEFQKLSDPAVMCG